MRPPGALDREELLTPADREFFHRIGAMRFSGSVYNPGAQAPRRMFADPNGDAMWVANWWGHNLAKIDIHTLEPTYYQLPIEAHPYATAVDRNHMVWTNLSSDDAVAKLDPSTGRYTIYKLPSIGTELRHIAVDDAGGPDVWGGGTASPVERRAFSSEPRHGYKCSRMPPPRLWRGGDIRFCRGSVNLSGDRRIRSSPISGRRAVAGRRFQSGSGAGRVRPLRLRRQERARLHVADL